MILGTHNSATGGQLLWWLRPLAWVINPTSKCQDKSIKEQLEDGVRLFNLQVTKYKGQWVFSHGLAIYREKLNDALELFKVYATKENPIYFQLYLDDNLFLGQPCEEFRELMKSVVSTYGEDSNIKLCQGWIEGSKEYFGGIPINCEEHYWTLGWAKNCGETLVDFLPLPKRHAREWNAYYKVNCKAKYLMLDFYELD